MWEKQIEVTYLRLTRTHEYLVFLILAQGISWLFFVEIYPPIDC